MSAANFSSLPTAAGSEGDADADHYNKICEKVKHLLETLPRGEGWKGHHVYNYNGFWLSAHVLENNLLLHAYFKSRPTDIFLASFMKAGNTWLKALMFSTLNRDRYSFSDHPLHHRGPQSTIPHLDGQTHPIPDFTNLPDPRLFATHFARTLLPPCISSCKIVYVCRDPKDVLISKWIFMNKHRSKEQLLTLDDAFERFCQGVSEWGPFWEHVLSYWRASLESTDKILFLKYEEIKKEPEVAVKKLAEFMGKPFTVDEEKEGVVREIVKLCSFENLSNLEVNKNGVEKFPNFVPLERRWFFRKGEVGDWKNYLSLEMKDRIDMITNEKLQGSGLMLTPTN